MHVLQASGLSHPIIRPTGYFSDMGEYFPMAKSGRAYLVGDGQKRLNPIHGADLFDFFVTAGKYENVAPRYGTHTLEDSCRALD